MKDMFIGRDREMAHLEAIYSEEGWKTCAVLGRRRVGKTTLLAEFCKGKRALYFQFLNRSFSENMRRARQVMAPYTGTGEPYRYFADFLFELAGVCREERTVVVFDEFPYLSAAEDCVASSVQCFVDQDLKGTDSMLIICGSSVSMMKGLIEGAEQPLYGRFYNRITVGPIPLADTAEFHPGMSDRDLLMTYMTVGGVPAYHRLMRRPSYSKCLEECFFSQDAPLLQEYRMIVDYELSPAEVYSEILYAISDGYATQKEICQKLGISQSLFSRYADVLERLGLISSPVPMLSSRRRVSYRISDPVLAFGYGIAERHSAGVGITEPAVICRNAKPDVQTYMGRAFEAVVAEYVLRSYGARRIGRWEGRCGGETADIDVVATARTEDGLDVTILCECKFRKGPMDLQALNDLRLRAEAAGCIGNRRLMLASAGGFTSRLAEYAEDSGAMLVGLDKLLGRVPPDPLWPGPQALRRRPAGRPTR